MTAPLIEPVRARTEEIYAAQLGAEQRRTSRMFAWLMVVQWAGAIVAACIISPYTWIGERQRVNEHVWAALVIGGLLASLPIVLALRAPERRITRHVIAVAQMLFSALLIHMTGGRIETHFHVFGSLAFLAFYRDWPVLITATVVIALDHMIRGIAAPLSVFGIGTASPWRWVEHAGWVVFEDSILIFSCRRGLAELHAIAERQAGLEEAKAATEAEVRERTRELRETNEQLHATVAERQTLHEKLVAASREAGMAEVAVGVLHNVGNVLNSINVATTVLHQRLRDSELPGLVRASGMLREHAGDLPVFLRDDERGRHLPDFLVAASQCLKEEHESLARELETVSRGVEHVKQVISLQQSHARRRMVAEPVVPGDLIEAALQMQERSDAADDIRIERRAETARAVRLDRHQVLQILINLISNARHATRGCAPGQACITITTGVREEGGAHRVRFEVADNGVGIPSENLTKIFSHGFTTRSDGHGFGLHASATAAQAMGGSLRVHSDGPGTGARFTLLLPVARPEAADSIQQQTRPNAA